MGLTALNENACVGILVDAVGIRMDGCLTSMQAVSVVTTCILHLLNYAELHHRLEVAQILKKSGLRIEPA